MVKKNLPVGVDDFKKIIENNYYFVDKSMLIDELLSKRSEVTLLPRPRRFGKTLNMSMLNYFFNIEDRENNRKLFNNLNISNTDKIIYQGEYPVIYISLKDIKVSNWIECFEEVKKLLKDIFNTKRYIREKLDESEKIDFDKIEFLNETGDFMGALKNLSKYLFKFYGKKTIILIDEYDTPLVTAHSEGYYNEALFFFHNFLNAALKGNPYLEFSVLTGISRICYGVNNFAVSTILDNQFNHFGLTENEIEEVLKYYELDYKLDEVKKWYNGYRFGGNLVYNPDSTMNFINNKELGSYRINTSDKALIKQLLNKNDSKILDDLKALFNGKEIEEFISENIVLSDLKYLDTIWSLMLFSGYLTCDRSRVSNITGIKTYFLKIPNYEIMSFFKQNFPHIENQIN